MLKNTAFAIAPAKLHNFNQTANMSNYLKKNQMSPTRNLTLLYVAALLAIAVLLLFGYLFVRGALARQSSDSHVINIAGRQRMLSQKLSKDALAVNSEADAERRAAHAARLRETLDLWKSSQVGLQNGDAEAKLPGDNSLKVLGMFAAVEPHFQTMLDAGNELFDIITANPNALNRLATAPLVEKILANEAQYLRGMNDIVFEYDREATARVAKFTPIAK
jgi:hypothetical protein